MGIFYFQKYPSMPFILSKYWGAYEWVQNPHGFYHARITFLGGLWVHCQAGLTIPQHLKIIFTVSYSRSWIMYYFRNQSATSRVGEILPWHRCREHVRWQVIFHPSCLFLPSCSPHTSYWPRCVCSLLLEFRAESVFFHSGSTFCSRCSFCYSKVP